MSCAENLRRDLERLGAVEELAVDLRKKGFIVFVDVDPQGLPVMCIEKEVKFSFWNLLKMWRKK